MTATSGTSHQPPRPRRGPAADRSTDTSTSVDTRPWSHLRRYRANQPETCIDAGDRTSGIGKPRSVTGHGGNRGHTAPAPATRGDVVSVEAYPRQAGCRLPCADPYPKDQTMTSD